MGVGSSATDINPIFESIQKWPWSRAAAVLKAYHDEEYDFGIDASTVSSITGLTLDESKQLIRLLSKDKKGLIVNALTLLSVMICLADSSQQMLETRAGAIFDLFDFDGTAQINQDETTILLMCVGTAMACILRNVDTLQDTTFTSLTTEIYEDREKKSSRVLLRHEFLSWINKTLFEIPQANTETIYRVVYLKDILPATPAAATATAAKSSESLSPKESKGETDSFDEGEQSSVTPVAAAAGAKEKPFMNTITSMDAEEEDQAADAKENSRRSSRSSSRMGIDEKKTVDDEEGKGLEPSEETKISQEDEEKKDESSPSQQAKSEPERGPEEDEYELDEYEESFEKDESVVLAQEDPPTAEEKSPRNSPKDSKSPRAGEGKGEEDFSAKDLAETKISPRRSPRPSEKGSPRPQLEDEDEAPVKDSSPRPVSVEKAPSRSPRGQEEAGDAKSSPRASPRPVSVKAPSRSPRGQEEAGDAKSSPRASPRPVPVEKAPSRSPRGQEEAGDAKSSSPRRSPSEKGSPRPQLEEEAPVQDSSPTSDSKNEEKAQESSPRASPRPVSVEKVPSRSPRGQGEEAEGKESEAKSEEEVESSPRADPLE